MERCRYKERPCKIFNKHCNAKVESDCGEAETFSKKFCPLMIATQTPIENCTCDIPHIRQLWPTDKKCFDGNECLPRKYEPVRQQIDKITNPAAISSAFAAAQAGAA